MVGLQPLHSDQQAEKFHHEVPGNVIPEDLHTRLRQAGETATLVGLEIIKELFAAICPSVQGAYIMTLGRYDLVGELLPYIRERSYATHDGVPALQDMAPFFQTSE